VVNFSLPSESVLTSDQRAYLEAAVNVTSAALSEQLSRQEARLAREEKLALERMLLSRVLASQEDERMRLSRELHDDLGQALSALLLEIGSASGGDAASFVAFRKRMEGSIRALVDRVAMLAWELRPAILDDYGLPHAVGRYAERLRGVSGLEIDFQYLSPAAPGQKEGRLPPEVELVLYRITQEALNNVVKHARARRVSVLLTRQPTEVAVLVEDDGIGFEVERVLRGNGEQCLGLRGMEERASLIRGRLRIESAPGKGTTLKATVPLG